MKKTISVLSILTAAILWGCIGIFYKYLSGLGFTSIQVVFLRVLTAAVFMLAIVVIRDPALLKIRLRDCWMFIGTGICSLAFFNFCYFRAIDELSPSVAAVLLYTAPIIVMVLSLFLFKERITVKKIVSLVMTFTGCLLVTGIFSDSRATWSGVLLGIGAGVGYALYTIFGTFALRKYKTETITLYTFLFATVGVLPLCGIGEMVRTVVGAPVQAGVGSLLIGCLAALMPYWLYTHGLKQVSPSNASMMATLEPVVAAVVGVCFLEDQLTSQKTIGILLIISAIVFINLPVTITRKKDRLG